MNENYFGLEYNTVVPQVIVLRMSHQSMINYCYLVIDHINHQSVIVDPAWDMKKIDLTLLTNKTSLNGILLTHSHMDHIHLAKPLAEKYCCPIWMSNEEIAVSGFSAPQLIGMNMSPWFIGNIYIQPILTQGHTSGSICFLIEDNLFTGDTLFIEGCGLCRDKQSAQTMYASLKFLKNMLNPNTKIFPGHSYRRPPGQKFSLLLRENMYLQFKNENDFVTYRLRENQNDTSFFDFR